MNTEKISLMDAYLIETLRTNDVSNEQILQINEASIEEWSRINENFDFTQLLPLAADQSQFQSILNDGYTIKFLTYNGLMNMLRMRFGKEADEDFVKEEQGVSGLSVDSEQLSTIKQMLSSNWTVTQEEGKETYAIQPTG